MRKLMWFKAVLVLSMLMSPLLFLQNSHAGTGMRAAKATEIYCPDVGPWLNKFVALDNQGTTGQPRDVQGE